ncbi:hypothetical protein [Streptomyces umbrinus]|uniref:hypothetical protein n=1 Tax=Streptomyces umbrinus TaxID=67370 RepID=UPI0033FE0716
MSQGKWAPGGRGVFPHHLPQLLVHLPEVDLRGGVLAVDRPKCGEQRLLVDRAVDEPA